MRYTTIGEIKAMDIGTVSLDDLVLAHATLTLTVEEYKRLAVDVPENLTGLLKDIKREVEDRTRAEKERKLKALRVRREALKTPDEKRASIDAQIAELEKQVA